MERKEGSGRKRAARTPANGEAVEELVCSQKKARNPLLSPKFNLFKRMKTPHERVSR